MTQVSRKDLVILTDIEVMHVWGGKGGSRELLEVARGLADAAMGSVGTLLGSTDIGPEAPRDRTPVIIRTEKAEETLVDHIHTA